MPSVGVAGLLGPKDAHYRGAPNPSHLYSKNALVPSVRIWRSVVLKLFSSVKVIDGHLHKPPVQINPKLNDTLFELEKRGMKP